VRPGSEIKLNQTPGIEIVHGNITQPETLAGIGNEMDCLLHLATLGHMSNFTVPEEMFEAINVSGTRNIMEEALKAGIKKIVHCSSVAAMGICDDIPATENSPCKPHHAYGRSKLQAEILVKAMVSEKNLPATIVRFSMVYGPGDPRDILKLTRMAKRGTFPQIGSKPKLTPLIHVEDAVSGLLLAADRGRAGEVYLLTNKNSEPFDQIRKIIQEALGTRRPTIHIPESAALALALLIEKTYSLVGKTPPVTRKNIESTLADRIFSIAKAQRELGFEPTVDPAEGLRETVMWYKEKGWV
jgi:nucleoside-diphosphate-sugar epimerase